MPLSATATAVCLTVASSAASAIGKARQKAATRSLPALGGGGRSVLREYLRSPLWVSGLALDVVGGLLIMVAYSMAPVRMERRGREGARRHLLPNSPSGAVRADSKNSNLLLHQVSLVQPVSGIGLVILAVYSHFALGERMSGRQWVAAGAAAAGTALLGATSGGGPVEEGAALPPPPDAARAVLGLAGAAFLVLAAPRLSRRLWRRASGSGGGARRKGGTRAPPPPSSRPFGLRARSASFTGSGAFSGGAGSTGAFADAADTAVAGLAGRAGACYGLAAAACRAGFSLPPASGAGPATASAAAAAGVAASIALSAAGTALQTAALKPGNPVVVVTLSAVAAMATGVAAGVAALGVVGRPVDAAARLLQILAWVLTVGGVTVLAGSSGGGSGGEWEDGGGVASSSLRAGAMGAAAALDAALPPSVRARLPVGIASELRRAASLARGGAHCHAV